MKKKGALDDVLEEKSVKKKVENERKKEPGDSTILNFPANCWQKSRIWELSQAYMVELKLHLICMEA